jgi:hypothetical protein
LRNRHRSPVGLLLGRHSRKGIRMIAMHALCRGSSLGRVRSAQLRASHRTIAVRLLFFVLSI